MSFKKELEESIENIRAIEMSFVIAKDLEVLLPSFFDNNSDRLALLRKELKRIKRMQSKRQFKQKIQKTMETCRSVWQSVKDKMTAKKQHDVEDA